MGNEVTIHLEKIARLCRPLAEPQCIREKTAIGVIGGLSSWNLQALNLLDVAYWYSLTCRAE